MKFRIGELVKIEGKFVYDVRGNLMKAEIPYGRTMEKDERGYINYIRLQSGFIGIYLKQSSVLTDRGVLFVKQKFLKKVSCNV